MKSIYNSKIYQNLSCLSTTFKTIYRNLCGKKFESEAYVLSKFISPATTCFDIGAAYGRYTLIMSKLVGDSGQVYCFEPGNYSYKVLSNVVKFHRLKNVTLVKKALSDKEGVRKLLIPVKSSGKLSPSLAYLGNLDNEFGGITVIEEIQTTTLDKCCLEMNISKLDFIKCDVEGAELLVFRGARNVLSLYKPTVLCEVDKRYLDRFDSSPDQIHNFFYHLGYRTFILKNNKFEEIDQIKEDYNYFFIHSKD